MSGGDHNQGEGRWRPIWADELATIEARARAATPGEWGIEPNTLGHRDVWAGRGTDEECVAQAMTAENAAHVAAMDPATTLRLLTEIRLCWDEAALLHAELDRIRGEVAS